MSEELIIAPKSELVDIAEATREKLGVTTTYYTSELGPAIRRIKTFADLPALSSPGSPSDLRSGKELIDQDGNKVTGTVPSRSSSDLSVSGDTVTVPSGIYSSDASASVASGTLESPTYSVNPSSFPSMTISSRVSKSGYLEAGGTSSVVELTGVGSVDGNKMTVTPGTSEKSIVDDAGLKYVHGPISVAGDADLVAGNIKKDVEIFGVTGTYEGDKTAGALSNPSITVSSSGLITATSGVSTAGYLDTSASASNTKQLTTKSATTITPSSSAQTAVSSGVYTTGAITVAAIPTGSLGTNTVSIANSTGKITATAKVTTAGYLSTSASSTGSLQLTTQAAKTVTPSSSAQTAVAANVYTTGAVMVAGDTNLVAGNIKSGTKIFGVTGTYTGAAVNYKKLTITVSGDKTADTLIATDATIGAQRSNSALEISLVPNFEVAAANYNVVRAFNSNKEVSPAQAPSYGTCVKLSDSGLNESTTAILNPLNGNSTAGGIRVANTSGQIYFRASTSFILKSGTYTLRATW